MGGSSKGKVIGYAPHIVIKNARLVVSQAGRERVLSEQRKNVHAGCVGTLVSVNAYIQRLHVANLNDIVNMYSTKEWMQDYLTGLQITYNPYLYDSFVETITNQPVYEASKVIFDDNIVRIVK